MKTALSETGSGASASPLSESAAMIQKAALDATHLVTINWQSKQKPISWLKWTQSYHFQKLQTKWDEQRVMMSPCRKQLASWSVWCAGKFATSWTGTIRRTTRQSLPLFKMHFLRSRRRSSRRWEVKSLTNRKTPNTRSHHLLQRSMNWMIALCTMKSL